LGTPEVTISQPFNGVIPVGPEKEDEYTSSGVPQNVQPFIGAPCCARKGQVLGFTTRKLDQQNRLNGFAKIAIPFLSGFEPEGMSRRSAGKPPIVQGDDSDGSTSMPATQLGNCLRLSSPGRAVQHNGNGL
jgi:hypothetical protein